MNFKVFKTLVGYIMIVGWETCDLSLTCNWFNQNIKSLSNVEFEIKVRLNMFQNYIKKMGKFNDLIFWKKSTSLVFQVLPISIDIQFVNINDLPTN